ncbi:DUF3742 family protein [Gallibacterium anatis]|uniref:Uncharacterized protein n=1 Tax=Gallibacterium anatis TaxID=750 RepID=A0A1A7P850_9PAST|nr:DUF3742 family protein [Gallibacterium anatis]OBW98223.1 hypothetical protein QV03_07480 [Gallibacterium anatis]
MMVYKIITALCVIAGLVFLWKSFKLQDKWTRLSKKGKYSLIIVLCGLILFSNIWAVLGVILGIGFVVKIFMNSGGIDLSSSDEDDGYRDGHSGFGYYFGDWKVTGHDDE